MKYMKVVLTTTKPRIKSLPHDVGMHILKLGTNIHTQLNKQAHSTEQTLPDQRQDNGE